MGEQIQEAFGETKNKRYSDETVKLYFIAFVSLVLHKCYFKIQNTPNIQISVHACIKKSFTMEVQAVPVQIQRKG